MLFILGTQKENSKDKQKRKLCENIGLLNDSAPNKDPVLQCALCAPTRKRKRFNQAPYSKRP